MTDSPEQRESVEIVGRYRKRPVVIEAARSHDLMQAAGAAWNRLPPWVREAYDSGQILFHRHGIDITTLEGTMRADRGDWVIRGVKGEIYPCKPDIFEATYEAVPDAKP